MLKKSVFIIHIYFFNRQFDKVNQLHDSKIPVNETGEC